jgi:hypothetical protein
MPENFNDAAAVQHIRHDERPDRASRVNLVKERAEPFPFNVQIQNDELRLKRLQKRNNLSFTTGTAHDLNASNLFEVRFQTVPQDGEVTGE